MMISKPTKRLWLWLHSHPGLWTAQQVAQRTGVDSAEVFTALHEMSRPQRSLVQKADPELGERRMRYGVTHECQVPTGITLAELQKHKRTGEPTVIVIEAPARPAAAPVHREFDLLGMLSPAELPYLHRDMAPTP